MIVFVAGSGLREVCGDQSLLGLTFLRETRTAPIYRLYAIDGRFAALVEIGTGGNSVAGELCELADERAAMALAMEPAGLTQQLVTLENGEVALGPVATHATLAAGAVDISSYGGFAAYFRDRRAAPDLIART
jgi:hypothetical protein